MTRFLRAPGVLIEPLGEGWAVFSALSGETHLVNGESVEVLERLDTDIPRSAAQVCELLAAEYDAQPAELLAALAAGWDPLVEAGLVRHAPSDDTNAA